MAIGIIGLNPVPFQVPTAPAASFPVLPPRPVAAPAVRPALVRPAAPAGSFPMTSAPLFTGVANGGGPIFSNSSSASAQALQALFANENPNSAGFLAGAGSFFGSAIGLQFASGDLISSALGMAQVSGGNTGNGVDMRQLTSQLQQTYGPLLEAEAKVQEESVATFQELKKEVFADHHYEFDGAGQNPKLVAGRETTAQRAQRLAYERKQKIAAAQRVASSPQATEQRRLSELVARNPGNKALLLQLDAVNTSLQVESMRANLAAELPVGADAGPASDAVAGLRSFAESAITDWAGLHTSTIQRMAADPNVDLLLNAQAEQQRKLAESQAALAQASQQMLAQGQALARPF